MYFPFVFGKYHTDVFSISYNPRSCNTQMGNFLYSVIRYIAVRLLRRWLFFVCWPADGCELRQIPTLRLWAASNLPFKKMDIGFSCVDGRRKYRRIVPTFNNVADFWGIAERSGFSDDNFGIINKLWQNRIQYNKARRRDVNSSRRWFQLVEKVCFYKIMRILYP